MSTATSTAKVIDLFSGQEYQTQHHPKVVRLAPEFDGFEVLYSNQHGHPIPGQELFSVKILFWALLDDGSFAGMIPWFDELIVCTHLNSPNKGFFQGYFDPGLDQAVPQVPKHKCIELITAAEYFDFEVDDTLFVVQELPDTCGSHERVAHWPVLVGDECLEACDDAPDFVNFFQYRVAINIKEQDADTMAVLDQLKSDL